MVKINGNLVDAVGKTISQYLQTTDYEQKRIAVERNGEIVFPTASTRFPLIFTIFFSYLFYC